MSVVGLTFGNAANAIRPSAANAASVPTSATTRASGRTRSYHANPPASASARIPNAPSCQLTRHPRARRAAPRAAAPRLRRRQRAARSAEDPRGLGREVRATGEDLGRRAVGDHRALSEQHDPLGERGHELGVVGRDQHRRVELAQQRGELVLAPRSIPRVGSSRHTTAGGRGSLVEHDREREPLLLPARQVARVAAGERGRRARRSRARRRGLLRDPLVDQVVGRVLEQQRDPPALRTFPRVGRISPAAWRSSVDLPAPLRPISATRSPRRELSSDSRGGWPARVRSRARPGRARARLPRRRADAAGVAAHPRRRHGRAPASGSSPRARRAERAAFTPGTGAQPEAVQERAPGVASSGAASHAQARNSAGAASQTTRPPRIAIARSAKPRQRSSRCSAITIAASKSSLSRRSSAISSSPATGSSCEVGSSSRISCGRPASAAPSATRWSSPPDSSAVGRSSRCAIPSASAASSTARATAAGACPGSRAAARARRGRFPSRPASRDPGTASRRRPRARPAVLARVHPGDASPGRRTRRQKNGARARSPRAAASTCPSPNRRRAPPARRRDVERDAGDRRRRRARIGVGDVAQREDAHRRSPCGRRTAAARTA